jgi:hypothetical protein
MGPGWLTRFWVMVQRDCLSEQENGRTLKAWRKAARQRVLETMAPVNLGGKPEVKVESETTYDGLHIEHLSWQLPGGPRTEAVFLKPAGAQGRLPAVLGLHDHGGNKFMGWRKIARTDDKPWPIQATHHEKYYGAWPGPMNWRGAVMRCWCTIRFPSRAEGCGSRRA